ncbi:MAG: hydrogenase maturation protease [Opitutaceae bacterium]|nr:hydrogenase maturation protease [Opitutaceae bacterium]
MNAGPVRKAAAGSIDPVTVRPAAAPVLILGVGNLLVGDEGVGVHAVRALEREAWPAEVQIVDGGTGGLHLLGLLRSHPRVVLIDATRDGAPAGTVRSFKARVPADFPPALGAHDLGLRDLFAAAALLGPLPEIDVITVSVAELKPMTLDLSPPVAAALPEVARLVRELLKPS